MIKYCLTVFDRDTNIKLLSCVTNADNLLDTVKQFNELGIVKAFILDDKESEVK